MAKRNTGKLKDEHRAFVVQRLAVYDTPKEAAEAVRERFGVEVSPQSCEAYDPTKRAGERLAKRWRDMFEATRKDFEENVTRYVPEASKMVRIRHLAHAARALKDRKNYPGMADMLERIAKEVGNVHTNKRELTGKDGAPVEIKTTNLTDTELDARIAQLLGLTQGADAAAEGGDAG